VGGCVVISDKAQRKQSGPFHGPATGEGILRSQRSGNKKNKLEQHLQ